MRETKVRAFDEFDKKCWHYFHIPQDIGRVVDGMSRKLNYVHWTEWTGLKDKKGIEIYEGDIVQPVVIYGDEYGCSEVFFHDGAFSLRCSEKYWPCLYEANNILIEVIGNIHEHPHLIERTSTETSKGD